MSLLAYQAFSGFLQLLQRHNWSWKTKPGAAYMLGKTRLTAEKKSKIASAHFSNMMTGVSCSFADPSHIWLQSEAPDLLDLLQQTGLADDVDMLDAASNNPDEDEQQTRGVYDKMHAILSRVCEGKTGSSWQGRGLNAGMIAAAGSCWCVTQVKY